MKIEHLIEPKLKDLEREVKNLRNSRNSAEGYMVDNALATMEVNRIAGIKSNYNTSNIIQRPTGYYKVTIIVEEL
jgi:hypothetical protein